ncbi:hypothetical protein [uncultured virus]|jgi:hypothetical protein|uniref:Uncharacterized protein n=1 Tax=uncultured virus TaxID=340016 RepID=A0A5Q0TWG5_9VIRU|nr:hypothetical protein [uncultured virus]
MVKIIKAGKTFRMEKGVVIYVGKDLSVKAELIEQPKIVSVDANLYSCAIFISEEDKKWRQK